MESPGGLGPVGDGDTSGIVVLRLPRPRGCFRCWGPLCCAVALLARVFGGQTMAFGKGQFAQIALAARLLELESWGRGGLGALLDGFLTTIPCLISCGFLVGTRVAFQLQRPI